MTSDHHTSILIKITSVDCKKAHSRGPPLENLMPLILGWAQESHISKQPKLSWLFVAWSPHFEKFEATRPWGPNTPISPNLLAGVTLLLLLLLLLSRFSHVRICVTPQTAAHKAPPSLGFSRQEHWSGLPFPSPMQESEKWKWSHWVLSDS